MTTIALAIPFASWAPGRRHTLDRLLATLGLPSGHDAVGSRKACPPGTCDRLFVYDNREPRHAWCGKIQEWGLETEASHFLQLQDDLRVAPAPLFWPALRAMIEAHPGVIINLQAVHQDAPALLAEGVHGYTTTEGMPGPAYVVPMPLLREFRYWIRTALVDGALEKVTEDTLLGIFAMVTGRPIWAPIPTIVDHPGDAGSTYGNEKAIRQRPLVRWDTPGLPYDAADLCRVDFWEQAPRHLGRFYDVTPQVARTYVKGYSAADYDRDRAEPCRPLVDPPCAFCGRPNKGVRSDQTGVVLCGICLRQAAPLVGGRFAKPGTPLVVIATPLKGSPHPMHADAICRLRAEETLNVEQPYEIAAWSMPADDLVRVRSRIVRDTVELRKKGKPVTHLLFVDGDVVPTPLVVHRMLAAKKPFVTAPYPLRVIDWREVDKQDGRPAEARAYGYWHIQRMLGGMQAIDETGCVEIVSNGLGCALLEVELLERMVEHYGKDVVPARLEQLVGERPRVNAYDGSDNDVAHPVADTEDLDAWLPGAIREAFELGRQSGRGLVFDDVPMPGMPVKATVALFDLELKDRQLQSEDKSFCRRVRAMGEKVWLYLGPGAPLDHFGETRFRGMAESLDIRPLATKEKTA